MALLERVVLLDQELDGLEEAVEVQEEGNQRTDGQGVVQHHRAADGQEEGLAQDADGLGARSIDGVDPAGGDVGVTVGADHVAMVERIVGSAVVGGDDPDTVERLREIGHDVGDPITDAFVAAL